VKEKEQKKKGKKSRIKFADKVETPTFAIRFKKADKFLQNS
jgi:hypothetical protein